MSADSLFVRSIHRLSRWRSLFLIGYTQHRYAQRVLSQPDLVPPSREVRRHLREVARRRFGSVAFAPELLYMAALNPAQAGRHVPQSYYRKYVVEVINNPYRQMSGARTLTRRFFPEFVAHLPDVLYRHRGMWYGPDLTPLSDAEAGSCLQPDALYYVKEEAREVGSGVKRMKGQDVLPYARILNATVQPELAHHPTFNAIMQVGTAVVRILTGLPWGTREPEVVGAYMRILKGTEPISRGANEVLWPFSDLSRGVLAPYGFGDDYDRLYRHPDTGEPFAGYTVPAWSAVTDLCRAMHRAVPQFGLIGWDVVVGADAFPYVIEWNTPAPGMQASEILYGPFIERLLPPGYLPPL